MNIETIQSEILKPEKQTRTEYKVFRYLTIMDVSIWNLNGTFPEKNTALNHAKDLKAYQPNIPVKVQEWKLELTNEWDIEPEQTDA